MIGIKTQLGLQRGQPEAQTGHVLQLAGVEERGGLQHVQQAVRGGNPDWHDSVGEIGPADLVDVLVDVAGSSAQASADLACTTTSSN